MNWKALVAVVVVLGILGLIALTEQGRNYAVFLGKGMGSLVGFVLKSSPGKPFSFGLSVKREAFYGQSFPLSDSSLKISGQGSSVKIGGNVWSLDSGEVEMEMTGKGDFAINADGNVRLSVDAKTFKLDGKSTNDVKVEAEIVPTEFSLSGIKKDGMNITSASGTILKVFDSTMVTANFTKSNLWVGNFFGTIEMDTQTASMSGTATSIEVNGRNV